MLTEESDAAFVERMGRRVGCSRPGDHVTMVKNSRFDRLVVLARRGASLPAASALSALDIQTLDVLDAKLAAALLDPEANQLDYDNALRANGPRLQKLARAASPAPQVDAREGVEPRRPKAGDPSISSIIVELLWHGRARQEICIREDAEAYIYNELKAYIGHDDVDDPYSLRGSIEWLQRELRGCGILGVASHLNRIDRALKGLPPLGNSPFPPPRPNSTTGNESLLHWRDAIEACAQTVESMRPDYYVCEPAAIISIAVERIRALVMSEDSNVDPYSPLGSIEWLQDELQDCGILGVASHLNRIARALKGLPSLAPFLAPSRPDPATDGGWREAILAEREACAERCDRRQKSYAEQSVNISEEAFPYHALATEAGQCAAAIRARPLPAPPEPVAPKPAEAPRDVTAEDHRLLMEALFHGSTEAPVVIDEPDIITADAPPTDRDAAGGASEVIVSALDALVERERQRTGSTDYDVQVDAGAKMQAFEEAAALARRLDHQPATDALRQIAALRHSLPRHSVTQDNAVEAFGRLNRHIIGIFDLADAALAGGQQDRTAPDVGEDEIEAACKAAASRFREGSECADPIWWRVEIRHSLEAAAKVRAARTTPPVLAEPADSFAAHLSESLGTIGDRVIGAGHVVISEERYEWLRQKAGLATPPASTGTEASR